LGIVGGLIAVKVIRESIEGAMILLRCDPATVLKRSNIFKELFLAFDGLSMLLLPPGKKPPGIEEEVTDKLFGLLINFVARHRHLRTDLVRFLIRSQAAIIAVAFLVVVNLIGIGTHSTA